MEIVNSPASPGSRADAVVALWEASAAPLRSWFARRLAPEDAEDLVQETFLRVQERLDSSSGPRMPGGGGADGGPDARTVRGWVATVARHAWIDHLRRRRPGAELTEEVADPDAESEDNLDAVVSGWLESFLDQLDPEDAEALRATDLGGLTQAQLADRLGLSISGTKSRVQRARARLRERLEACCALAFDARGSILEARPRHPGCPEC